MNPASAARSSRYVPRGRELVDFLTFRIEERVWKEVDVAEPRIRTLEAPGARLGEHHLANHEIAELTLLQQAPDLRFVGGAVVAVVFGENECPVPSAHNAVHRVVGYVEDGVRAHDVGASRSWTISENPRSALSDSSSVSLNSCQLKASSLTSPLARTVAVRRVSASSPTSPKNCPGPSVASSSGRPPGSGG